MTQRSSSKKQQKPRSSASRDPRQVESAPHEAVQACLRRVSDLLHRHLPDGDLEFHPNFAQGRIDMVMRQNGRIIGRSFVTIAECERAYLKDPIGCEDIETVASGWVGVLQYRARQLQRTGRTVFEEFDVAEA